MSIRFVLSSVLVLITWWQSCRSRETTQVSSNWTDTVQGKNLSAVTEVEQTLESQLFSEMKKLKAENDEQRTRLFILENQTDFFITEEKEKLSKTSTKIAELQEENKALRAELLNTSNNLSGKVTRLENDSRSLCTAIDSIKAEAGEAKSQLDKLSEVTSTLGSQHSSIDTQLQALRIGNMNLQKAITFQKQQVFFRVTFEGDWLKVPRGILIFDKVISNIGNTYKNGIFTAPYKGLYVFTVEIGCRGYCVTTWDLMEKSTPQALFGQFYPTNGKGFYLVPLKLSRGDTVYVKKYYSDPQGGDYHNTFSGWLVRRL